MLRDSRFFKRKTNGREKKKRKKKTCEEATRQQAKQEKREEEKSTFSCLVEGHKMEADTSRNARDSNRPCIGRQLLPIQRRAEQGRAGQGSGDSAPTHKKQKRKHMIGCMVTYLTMLSAWWHETSAGKRIGLALLCLPHANTGRRQLQMRSTVGTISRGARSQPEVS